MAEYYVTPTSEPAGKLLEEIGCTKVFKTYVLRTENEQLVEALQELGYISSYQRAGRISTPRNETFRMVSS